MHIISGKSKCIDRSKSRERERERERERCVFLNFVIFLTLRTRLRISKLCVYIDEMSLSNGICADGEQVKAFFCFLKEERKCSDSSVVRG